MTLQRWIFFCFNQTWKFLFSVHFGIYRFIVSWFGRIIFNLFHKRFFSSSVCVQQSVRVFNLNAFYNWFVQLKIATSRNLIAWMIHTWLQLWKRYTKCIFCYLFTEEMFLFYIFGVFLALINYFSLLCD